MRQQENLNFNNYLQRYPSFAQLPWRERYWLAELLADMREYCVEILPHSSVADTKPSGFFVEDVRHYLERKHGIEEYLMALTFGKLQMGREEMTGTQQERLMRHIIDNELQETVEHCLAAQLITRFYRNLKDTRHGAVAISGPRLFMAVRRSRAESDEHIQSWIDNAAQHYGPGVATKLHESRGDLLQDYRGLLQQQAAEIAQAQLLTSQPTATYRSVHEKINTEHFSDDEMLFSLSELHDKPGAAR